MERTPNTFDAHRLIWLAEKLGVQDAVIEGLFASYFTNGRDVGDRPVLMDIAVQAGLNRAKVEVLLAGHEGAEEVRQSETRPAALSGEKLGHFSSLVGVVVIARKLTYGNLVAIPAIAETKNTRRYQEDLWLGDLDSNQD
jgi:hypothetical protein